MIIFQTKNPEVNFDFSNATSFEVFSDTALSSTTSTYPTYSTKLSATTIENESGTYVVNWYSELTNSGNNNLTWFRVQWKRTSDVTWNELTEIDLLIPRGESFIPISGFRVINFASADTIDLRVQFSRDSGTARIKNSNIYVFRVAL